MTWDPYQTCIFCILSSGKPLNYLRNFLMAAWTQRKLLKCSNMWMLWAVISNVLKQFGKIYMILGTCIVVWSSKSYVLYGMIYCIYTYSIYYCAITEHMVGVWSWWLDYMEIKRQIERLYLAFYVVWRSCNQFVVEWKIFF